MDRLWSSVVFINFEVKSKLSSSFGIGSCLFGRRREFLLSGKSSLFSLFRSRKSISMFSQASDIKGVTQIVLHKIAQFFESYFTSRTGRKNYARKTA